MEFSFATKQVLREPITLVDSRLIPCRQAAADRHGFQQLQKMLYEIVDKMGEASAKAQGLHGAITTGKKLELANHKLYIMREENNNDVVGILKVGCKKLFVYDNCKVQHELEPLCILDFYVHESRQRMGCGRKLFDYMLSAEGIPACHLAVDRPSPKFLSFLQKHYHLKNTIPQVNNFVIFDDFFNNRQDSRNNRNRGQNSYSGNTNGFVNPQRPPSGRRANPIPFNPPKDNQYRRDNKTLRPRDSPTEELGQIVSQNWIMPGSGRQEKNHMGAGEMMYSRHGVRTPSNGFPSNRSTPTRGNQPVSYPSNPSQPSQHVSPMPQQPQTVAGENVPSQAFYKQLNGLTSPSTYYNTGVKPDGFPLPPKYPAQQQQRQRSFENVNNNNIQRLQSPQTTQQQRNGFSSTPNFGNRGTGSGGNSRYPRQESSQSNVNRLKLATPPPAVDPRYPSIKTQPDDFPTTHLPDISANQNGGSIAHRPPSGKQNSVDKREVGRPPLLQREGPPAHYKEMLNLHQTYQGRNGHLNVPQSPGYAYHPSPKDTTWTVMGVLRDQRLANSSRYGTNRLW